MNRSSLLAALLLSAAPAWADKTQGDFNLGHKFTIEIDGIAAAEGRVTGLAYQGALLAGRTPVSRQPFRPAPLSIEKDWSGAKQVYLWESNPSPRSVRIRITPVSPNGVHHEVLWAYNGCVPQAAAEKPIRLDCTDFIVTVDGKTVASDPGRGSFQVSVDGKDAGAVRTVSGLEHETEVVPYREGGVNFIHTRPGHPKTIRVELSSRGGVLPDWFQGAARRRAVQIRNTQVSGTANPDGSRVFQWSYLNCLPESYDQRGGRTFYGLACEEYALTLDGKPLDSGVVNADMRLRIVSEGKPMEPRRCSGLKSETEVFEYQEGGDNETVHHIETAGSDFGPVTVVRPAGGRDWAEWMKLADAGLVFHREFSFASPPFTPKGPDALWTYHECFPTAYARAGSGALDRETLTLQCSGFELALAGREQLKGTTKTQGDFNLAVVAVEIGGETVQGLDFLGGLPQQKAILAAVSGKGQSVPSLSVRSGSFSVGRQQPDDSWELWRRAVLDGKTDRRTVTIHFRNEAGQDVRRLSFEKAWPARWEGAELDAKSSGHATEVIELAFESMEFK